MRVDGVALREKREQLRAQFPGRGEQGLPAIGTQEWLADEAKISLRAVQYLEKGQASLKVIRAVSEVLEIEQWERLIVNYGVEYVHCHAGDLVDFRPGLYPPNNPDTFAESALQITLDPLVLKADVGKFDSFLLKRITGRVYGFEQCIELSWLAEVSLTPDMNTWLGWVRELDEIELVANGKNCHIPIMFKQDQLPLVSWGEFVAMVESFPKSQFEIDITLHFDNFDKHFRVYVSVDLLKLLFIQGRKKYGSELPYRAQVRAIQ